MMGFEPVRNNPAVSASEDALRQPQLLTQAIPTA